VVKDWLGGADFNQLDSFLVCFLFLFSAEGGDALLKDVLLQEHKRGSLGRIVKKTRFYGTLQEPIIAETIVEIDLILQVRIWITTGEKGLSVQDIVGVEAERVDLALFGVLADSSIGVGPAPGEHASLVRVALDAGLVLGASEVAQSNRLVLFHHNVLRLEIPVHEVVRVHLLQRRAHLENDDHARRCAKLAPGQDARYTTISRTTNLIGDRTPLEFDGAILVVGVKKFSVVGFKVTVGGAFNDEDPAVLVGGGLGVHLHNLLMLTHQNTLELVVRESLELGVQIVNHVCLCELKAVLRVDIAITVLKTSFDGVIVKEEHVPLTASAGLLKALDFSLFYSLATVD